MSNLRLVSTPHFPGLTGPKVSNFFVRLQVLEEDNVISQTRKDPEKRGVAD